MNYIYNIMYQILILIIPLITSPYLSRIIGVEGIGIYSYKYSIVYYFMLLTMLGVNNYGNRAIAKVRDNEEKLFHTFWSIYFLQLIMGIFMLCLYNIYIFIFDVEYKSIALIDNLFIISAILDINWLFFGLEEFKKTITRKTLVKILNIIMIFLFIKQANDLWKYTVIVSGMTCIGQIMMWFYLKSKIKYVHVSINEILKHFKQNLIMFIPVIAVSLYKMMDKIMLGYIAGVNEVGFYEQAERIINIPLTIITSLGVVMLPRISNISEKGDNVQILKYINKSIKFVMFLSFPMCFGLMAIGKKFAPLFYGESFQKSGILIILLSTTLPFMAFANVIRTQYLIPKEKDKIYIKSVTLGAVVNLIFNSLFISRTGSIGACLGTIFAEAMVMIYQTISIKNEISIRQNIPIIFEHFIKALIMYVIISYINLLEINSLYTIILQILFGVLIYCMLNINYILNEINLKKYIFMIIKKEGC